MEVLDINPVKPGNAGFGIKYPGLGAKIPYSGTGLKYILYFCSETPTESKGSDTQKWLFYRKVVILPKIVVFPGAAFPDHRSFPDPRSNQLVYGYLQPRNDRFLDPF